jgi:hypothetical protein
MWIFIHLQDYGCIRTWLMQDASHPTSYIDKLDKKPIPNQPAAQRVPISLAAKRRLVSSIFVIDRIVAVSEVKNIIGYSEAETATNSLDVENTWHRDTLRMPLS